MDRDRIVTDPEFLSRRSEKVNGQKEMELVVFDLMAMADRHKDKCLGLAANQVGYLVRIIVVKINDIFVPMVNPVFTMKAGGMKSGQETCLSFPNREPIVKRRYRRIGILYFDPVKGKYAQGKYEGLTARIIQHEIDHLNGVLI